MRKKSLLIGNFKQIINMLRLDIMDIMFFGSIYVYLIDGKDMFCF